MPRGTINVCQDVYERVERSNSVECFKSGEKYFGSASQTINGNTCLPWNTPGVSQLFEWQDNWTDNYCRNDGGMNDTPICLVDKSNYEECDIPKCEPEIINRTVCPDPVLDCHEVNNFQCMNSAQCVDINHVCDGQSHCSDGSDESPELCSRPFEIKLVGGFDEKTGRVEIRHRGIWGTICDDHFGDNEAKVVCRMLGFPTANAKFLINEGQYHNKGPIWIRFTKENDSCYGNESHLDYCKQSHLWENDGYCNHEEDAVVSCQ